jgi:hypothetical protein
MFRLPLVCLLLLAMIPAIVPATSEGAALSVEQSPLPWSLGDEIGKKGRVFVVSAIDRNAEFVRVRLHAAHVGDVNVEVRVGNGTQGPYSTGAYAVQPAPGQEAPDNGPAELLIGDVTEQLRAWQKRTGHRPFVTQLSARGEITPAKRPQSSQREATWTTPVEHGWGRHAGWLALNLLALVLCLLIARADALIPIVGGAVAMALMSDVPIWLINSMQEAGTGGRIEQLYGHGVHAGNNFTAVAHALTGGGGYGIADIARVNVVLWVAFAGLFVAFAIRRAGLLTGVTIAAVGVLNGIMLHAATSELPSMLVACYIALGAIAIANRDPERRGNVILLVGLFATLSVLLWGTRREVVVVPLLVGVFYLVDTALPRRVRTAWEVLSTLQRAGLSALMVALFATVLMPLAGASLEPECAEHWCYLARSMRGEELAASLVWLPGFLIGTALPIGFAVLLAAAMLRVLIAPSAALGLGVAMLLLYRVYFIAGHGITLEHYELYRYSSILLPLCTLLCVEVAAAVKESTLFTARSERTRRLLFVGLFVAMFAFPGGGSSYDPPWPQPLARNQQQEVRALLRWTASQPTCAFVSVVAKGGAGGAARQTELAVFGGRDSGVNPSHYSVSALPDLLNDIGHVACLRFYAGLDCLAVPRSCERFTRSEPLGMIRFAAAPYLADHFARPPAEGTLQVALHPLRRDDLQPSRWRNRRDVN